MEIHLFAFKAVRPNALQCAPLHTGLCHGLGKVKQQGQVRLQTLLNPGLQLFQAFPCNAAPTALIGEAGIGETIRDHDIAPHQCGSNDLFNVFTTGRKHDQGLGLGVHGLIEDDGAQAFPKRGSARLTGHHHRAARRPEMAFKPGQVRALAGAIESFKGNEQARHRALLCFNAGRI